MTDYNPDNWQLAPLVTVTVTADGAPIDTHEGSYRGYSEKEIQMRLHKMPFTPAPAGRLGYSIALNNPPKAPDMVTLSEGEFNAFIKKHFPNFGVEDYGDLPTNPTPRRFIHPDRKTMSSNEPRPENRIGMVIFSEPKKCMILKSVYDKLSPQGG